MIPEAPIACVGDQWARVHPCIHASMQLYMYARTHPSMDPFITHAQTRRHTISTLNTHMHARM